MHPIFLKIGFLEIRYYGLMYALSLLIAIKGIVSEFKRRGVEYVEDDILNIIIITFIGGLIFARLYYVLFNLSYYWQAPAEIIALWHGGLAIHGGIIGGVLAGIWATKKYKIKTWFFADALAPYLMLGQTLGRFGNFMNGDAHGLPTNLPWGLVFPAGTPAGNEFPGMPLHPVMLYELFLNFVFFLILFNLRKTKYKDGYIFSLYLILYSIGRFVVSFFRADSLMLGSFRMAHIISVVIVALAVFLIKKYQLHKE